MQITKLFLNLASDFMRYISGTMLNNQHYAQDSSIPMEPIITRAKKLTNKQDVLVVTYDQEGNS